MKITGAVAFSIFAHKYPFENTLAPSFHATVLRLRQAFAKCRRERGFLQDFMRSMLFMRQPFSFSYKALPSVRDIVLRHLSYCVRL